MEVCPQFNEDTNFVGAATIAQVKLFNEHPTGKVLKEERLRALAGDGGVQECGFAQNCVEVCPKGIPLTNAISDVSRDVVVQVGRDKIVSVSQLEGVLRERQRGWLVVVRRGNQTLRLQLAG